MRKISLAILSGLLAVAVFSRIAMRYLGFIPVPVIWALTGLLFILALLKPSKKWLIFGISFDLIVFGWQKIFHQQAIVPQSVLDLPFSSLPADTVNWAYFQYSYPYLVTIGLIQIICSFLLLFGRTRLLGLIMLIPVLLNIMMIDVFYQIGIGVLLHATILLAGVIYLLMGYFDLLKRVFSQKNEYNVYAVIAAAVIPFLLVFYSTLHR